MPTSRDKPHHDVATYRIPVDVRGCGIQSCLISSVCRLICFQDIVNRDLNMVHGTSRAPYLLDFWCHTIRSRSALTFCDAEEYFYGRYMRRKLIITSSVVVFFFMFYQLLALDRYTDGMNLLCRSVLVWELFCHWDLMLQFWPAKCSHTTCGRLYEISKPMHILCKN